ncbi:MAG TPA: hypothetical protein PKV55_11135 [Nitrospira sp.]|jgi:hypothetical protein|nr:hypothetical protein [Nitrospira sp.]MBS0164414.1 hypothetical protein [Nitrospira sp.]MBS0176272.1 hypothetical protein [Nitrospira sp.]MBX3337675.1 hypothetical protein [Nitrospira sp.]MCW5778076.1 hypothetical protein [Nitrospira sp.]
MMETQRTIHQRHLLLMAGLAFVSTALLLFPSPSLSQTLEDTVQFISDMANTHGFVRSLSCRNPKAGKPTKITEIYSVIPTGTRLGTVELNHGHDEVNTGFTHFDLHDIQTIEYQGQDTRDNNLVLYGVRLACTSTGPCIMKATFCTGAVASLEAQFAEDTLLFRSASHAERMTKALSHLLGLVRAQQQNQPF